jgi:uncharacterized protein YbbC (DUF1343 family)
MPGASRTFPRFFPLIVFGFGLFGCSASTPPPPPVSATAPIAQGPASLTLPKSSAVAPANATPYTPFPVMLGIDVLEAQGFAAVKGKRIGLLTHPAGVNRLGISTIDVLRHAPGVRLVQLYAVEHGLYNDHAAEKPFVDMIDPKSGLPVISLYAGHVLKPTAKQLKDIDALVIDLQDIGTRSYTFSGAMKTAMEGCFENGKEVIILDRPNPLGGLKADGPPLDADLMSDVGRFRVPYVHGLTMGELALMVKDGAPPGGLNISDAARAHAKLTVIPMRGWTRSMRWPETGLTWVPTSPLIQDFAAVEGCPMVGLGTILGGFKHGFRLNVGSQYAFRSLTHLTVKPDIVEKELRALHLPGLKFSRISVPNARTGEPSTGLFIEITDYDEWRPTELNFYLMKLACKLEPKNPFATASTADRRTFKVHVGSTAFFDDLAAKGAHVDIDAWFRKWQEQAKIYQEQSKRFWLYR